MLSCLFLLLQDVTVIDLCTRAVFLQYFIVSSYLIIMESLEEICQYLKPNTRLDLKAVALEHVLSE